jgi:hypothetical protein
MFAAACQISSGSTVEVFGLNRVSKSEMVGLIDAWKRIFEVAVHPNSPEAIRERFGSLCSETRTQLAETTKAVRYHTEEERLFGDTDSASRILRHFDRHSPSNVEFTHHVQDEDIDDQFKWTKRAISYDTLCDPLHYDLDYSDMPSLEKDDEE